MGAILLIAGIAAASRASRAAAILALAIATLAVVYDAWGKHRRFLGPVNMALCRGLNLLLGVAAVPSVLGNAWPVALLPFTYIAGVTTISRGEVHGGSRAVATASVLQVTAVVAALAVMSLRAGSNLIAGLALTLLLGWRVLPPFWRALRDVSPQTVRHAVRTGVLSLVLLDAAIGGVYAGAPYGLLILAMAPIAWLLARPFAVT
jgi:4-hydroxybenzoate polyprenyltransferase